MQEHSNAATTGQLGEILSAFVKAVCQVANKFEYRRLQKAIQLRGSQISQAIELILFALTDNRRVQLVPRSNKADLEALVKTFLPENYQISINEEPLVKQDRDSLRFYQVASILDVVEHAEALKKARANGSNLGIQSMYDILQNPEILEGVPMSTWKILFIGCGCHDGIGNGYTPYLQKEDYSGVWKIKLHPNKLGFTKGDGFHWIGNE